MGGNVREWTSTEAPVNTIPNPADDGMSFNPLSVPTPGYYFTPGGSWNTEAAYLSKNFAMNSVGYTSTNDLGFRIVVHDCEEEPLLNPQREKGGLSPTFLNSQDLTVNWTTFFAMWGWQFIGLAIFLASLIALEYAIGLGLIILGVGACIAEVATIANQLFYVFFGSSKSWLSTQNELHNNDSLS